MTIPPFTQAVAFGRLRPEVLLHGEELLHAGVRMGSASQFKDLEGAVQQAQKSQKAQQEVEEIDPKQQQEERQGIILEEQNAKDPNAKVLAETKNASTYKAQAKNDPNQLAGETKEGNRKNNEMLGRVWKVARPLGLGILKKGIVIGKKQKNALSDSHSRTPGLAASDRDISLNDTLKHGMGIDHGINLSQSVENHVSVAMAIEAAKHMNTAISAGTDQNRNVTQAQENNQQAGDQSAAIDARNQQQEAQRLASEQAEADKAAKQQGQETIKNLFGLVHKTFSSESIDNFAKSAEADVKDLGKLSPNEAGKQQQKESSQAIA